MLEKQLKVRKRTLPIIKSKESALRMEVKKCKDDLARLERELEEGIVRYDSMFALWNEFNPGLVRVKDVHLTVRKIAGTRIPVLDEVEFEIAEFSLFSQPKWYYDGINILKGLAHDAILVEFTTAKLGLLEKARKKTTQKVNLFEKVQIPGYEDAIRKIKRFMEDEENLSKSSQKILKSLLEAREAAKKEEEADLGVVHVIQTQQGAVQDAALQDDINLLARYKNALKELEPLVQRKGDGSVCVNPDLSDKADAITAQTGVSPLNTTQGFAFDTPAKVIERFEILEADRVVLEQTLAALNRDHVVLAPWGDFDPRNVERLQKAGYKMLFYSCPLRAFKDEWADKYGVIEILRDKQKVNFVTLTHADVEVDIDAEQVHLPQMSLSQIDSERDESLKAIQAIPVKKALLAVEGVPVLEKAIAELESKIDFSRVKLTGEKLAEDHLLLLEGWIPAAQVDETCKALDIKGVFYDVSDPTPEDDIPIQLSNNKFAKLFEPLTKLYMLPTYQELDLTLFFAPFFMLFFGLCLGDTGYGLLMIVALPIFTKLFQLINPNFSKWLVVLFGASTMLCGLLSGTFFGFNMYDLDIPFVQKMKGILYTDNSTMFTVSLCIGVVQILFGMGIKAVNLAIQCGFKYALSTIGWLILLITVGVSAIAGFDFGSPVIMGILIVAAVLIFLLNSPGKNPLLNIGLGLWDTYNMATGLLGDVLSYVRLFALGLSGGILANVFNSMAVGMAPDNKVMGFIVMVLIFVIGHALNIFMNILGAIVHPMRLTFVEFFKNSGYTGGGVEYKPFKVTQ